jgi:hypothetical protein
VRQADRGRRAWLIGFASAHRRQVRRLSALAPTPVRAVGRAVSFRRTSPAPDLFKGSAPMLCRHSARACGGFLVLGLLILSAGCGPNYKARATVKGKVTLGDKNLTTGTVMFYGKDNLTGSAAIGTDGTYVMNDAPLGDVKVTVSVSHLPPMGLKHLKDAPKGPVMPGETAPTAGKMPSHVVPIPEKYSKVDTSGLTYEVKRGEHEFNIPLTP